jgi:uncharacterized membrane protein (DUF485 family)
MKVFGEVNLAYLFALSQFFVARILAFIYVERLAGPQAAALIAAPREARLS